MDLVQFMQKYAKQLGGQFSEYDKEKSIIVVPLSEGRFQTIIGRYKDSQLFNKTMIVVSSKICQYKDSHNLAALLEENSNLHYAKFSMVDDYLKVEASGFVDQLTEDMLKEMIVEVAEVADNWEQRLTGVDVH